MSTHQQTTLIIGGTGKTGRRVAMQLEARGLPVRIGSRSGSPPFDWQARATWAPVLRGVGSMYVAYQPDVAVPGAAADIRALAELAVESGVRRVVLLSGRGEEGARASERALQASGAEWTVLRAAWFCQNFSEGLLLPAVLGGEIAFPAGSITEPFIDCDDIADVAVVALTQPGHAGKTYELTGPRLLTFAEAAAEISRASGRDVTYVPVSKEAYASSLAEHLPADQVAFISDLFAEVLDGHNAFVTDTVERVLGRKPRDFAAYARDAAAAGLWNEGAAA